MVQHYRVCTISVRSVSLWLSSSSVGGSFVRKSQYSFQLCQQSTEDSAYAGQWTEEELDWICIGPRRHWIQSTRAAAAAMEDSSKNRPQNRWWALLMASLWTRFAFLSSSILLHSCIQHILETTDLGSWQLVSELLIHGLSNLAMDSAEVARCSGWFYHWRCTRGAVQGDGRLDSGHGD